MPDRSAIVPVERGASRRFLSVTTALIAATPLRLRRDGAPRRLSLNPTPAQALPFGAELRSSHTQWPVVAPRLLHVFVPLLHHSSWSQHVSASGILAVPPSNSSAASPIFFAYFASGICGSIASVYWHPLAAEPARPAPFRPRRRTSVFRLLEETPSHLQIKSLMLGSLGTFIFYNLIYGAAIPGLSNAAHLGGLLMGLVVGGFCLPRRPPKPRPAFAPRLSHFLRSCLSAPLLPPSVSAPGVAHLASIQHSNAAEQTGEASAGASCCVASQVKL